MPGITTVRMSPRGQVTIPLETRKKLRLKAGTRFVVEDEGNAVLLKPLTSNSRAGVAELLEEWHRKAREAGIKQSDIREAIRRVRNGK